MVRLFRSPSHPTFPIFIGKDKHENEILLQNAHPNDVWFHVDDLSSAHVYVRIPLDSVWRAFLKKKFPLSEGVPPAGGITKITEEEYLSEDLLPVSLVEELSTLTKANSIQGSKLSEVNIVWTPVGNLLKEQQTMDTGTVGFVDEKRAWKIRNCGRHREILRALEKSEAKTDSAYVEPPSYSSANLVKDWTLVRELEERTQNEIRWRKSLVLARKEREKKAAKTAAVEKEKRSYSNLHLNTEYMAETNDRGGEYGGTIEECRELEDDFM